MFVHIGDSGCICDKDIIGIFDLEVTTTMRTTGDFLHTSAEKGYTENVVSRGEMPKSFILAEVNGETKVYISPVSTQTIYKRINRND